MPAKVIASTQDHLSIEDVRDDLVVMKNANAVMVIQTGAVNFDLLSEREQDAMIYSFGAFLNSLTFPVQIVIRSKLVDISNYLNKLDEAKRKILNPKLTYQIELYKNFIKELVTKGNILDKRFYIVVPHLEISLKQVTSTFGRKRIIFNKWKTLQKAKVALAPKR